MVGVTGFVEQLLNGVTIGMVYVLIAAGLSVIFGVMDVINFAHGELFALGAYFAFAIVAPFGGAGFWVALVVAPLLVGAVGAVIERLTLRPLYDRSPLYHILLTFGLVLMLNDVITFFWGKQSKALAAPPILDGPVTILGVTNSLYSYFIVAFGAVLSLATWWALNETRFGLVVRAGSMDREMVRNLGIDIDRYYTLVFGVGAALAAVAGVVLGAYQNVNPGMGNTVIIPAFVIVVLGGLGSFRGAVVGGLTVGVVQTLTRTYLPVLEGLVVFVLMIGVLLLKPEGLYGTPAAEESGDSEGELLAGRSGGVLTDRQRAGLGAAAVGLLAVVPLGVEVLYSEYVLTLLSDVLVWALFALSLDFVMGYAGLVSLGHALFYGTGAYAAVLVLLHVTPSAFVALAVAVVVCAAIAWAIGHVSIRVSGVYFSMITLAFAQLFYRAVFKFEWTGGSDGLFGAEVVYGIGGAAMELDEIAEAVPLVREDGLFYYFLLATVVGSYLVARRMMRAPFGSVLQSIRESERRTEFVGYDVTAYKRRAFVVSGAMAGLAGGLFAVQNQFVAPSLLFWLNSGEVVVMTVLGGMGTLYGPMVGAGVYIGFEDLLSSYTDQWQFFLGLVFVIFVIALPRGLVSLPEKLLETAGGRTGVREGREGRGEDEPLAEEVNE
ncbi:ABC transporter permease [Halorussus sp. MSC15.2]|uniref:ABC transporter permease n=1 Tax=Halorussus sp. MSC15.2 TaxID=2283638 RepID=UPI0013D005E0|nr:ABC transporter permease [Halorussus sp. MSC15.2]NEU58333.1 ABC transporter permease [Halorussus sp. MSC15.2]